MERLFTMKELDLAAIMKLIIASRITQKKASELSGYSLRHIGRKVNRYKKEGPLSLIHGNKGKPSNNKTSNDVEARIIEIMTTDLEGFGPTHGAEMLETHFNINITSETLRRMLIAHDLWHPNEVERLKHGWRERKAHLGEMLQADGSYHIWYGATHSTLVAFIDDATSRVELLFTDQETIESMTELLRVYITKYGRPGRLYTDRGKVFKVNNGSDDILRYTQFQRMLKELNIDLTHARSPQAKGRVERLFGTLQQRLVRNLAFYKITTMEEANEYLQREFIDEFNAKFSKEAREKADLHRPIEGIDLNSIFCYKEKRILKGDRTIRYDNRCFLLDKKQPLRLHVGYKVTVCTGFDGAIWLTAENKRLSCKEVAVPKKPKKRKETMVVSDNYHKPPKNHPWRNRGEWT